MMTINVAGYQHYIPNDWSDMMVIVIDTGVMKKVTF